MNPLTPEQQEAKELVAAYWAILMDKNEALLLSWMDDKETYGVPLVAKECAILAVEKILKSPLDSKEFKNGKWVIPTEYYQKVKQAITAM